MQALPYVLIMLDHCRPVEPIHHCVRVRLVLGGVAHHYGHRDPVLADRQGQQLHLRRSHMVGVIVIPYDLVRWDKLDIQGGVLHSQPVIQLLRYTVEHLDLPAEVHFCQYVLYHNSILYLVIISACLFISLFVCENESPLHQ